MSVIQTVEKQREERDVRNIAPEFKGQDFLDNYMNSNFPQTRFINKNKPGNDNDPMYDPLEEGKKEDKAMEKLMQQTEAFQRAQIRKAQSGMTNQEGTSFDNPASQ